MPDEDGLKTEIKSDAEFDLAAFDVAESVKTFLTYCPDGSERSATESAMDYVKGKYALNNFQYRKLCDTARAAYCDITKQPLKPYRPQRHQGKRR
jgi:hypothetical protein